MFASIPALAVEPVRIGAVLSVTGPASFLGEPEKNTIQMEAEKINAAGGVLGRPVEVLILDDETDVNKAVLAIDRLIKKEHVSAILGPTTSGNTLAVMTVSDHVTVLNFGHPLASGTPEAVQADPEVVRAYLGEEN